MKPLLYFLIVPLALLMGGCAHVLSREALQEVDPTIDYSQVKANPLAYQGKVLVLGGLIVHTQFGREGTTLEILRYTLDRWGEPQNVDEEGGRFLARIDRFLDPELYRAGRFVTLTGRVEAVETRPLQNFDYTYPVFRIAEVRIWTRRPAYYPYDYYYPWWPYRPFYGDPFWFNDPFWPYPHWRRPPWWW